MVELSNDRMHNLVVSESSLALLVVVVGIVVRVKQASIP